MEFQALRLREKTGKEPKLKRREENEEKTNPHFMSGPPDDSTLMGWAQKMP